MYKTIQNLINTSSYKRMAGVGFGGRPENTELNTSENGERMINLKKYEVKISNINRFNSTEPKNDDEKYKFSVEILNRRLKFYLEFPERNFNTPANIEQLVYATYFTTAITKLIKDNKSYASLSEIDTITKSLIGNIEDYHELEIKAINTVLSRYSPQPRSPEPAATSEKTLSEKKAIEAKDGVSEEIKKKCRSAKSKIESGIKEKGYPYYQNVLNDLGLSYFEDYLLKIRNFYKDADVSLPNDKFKNLAEQKLQEAKEWFDELPIIEQKYIKDYLNESEKASLSQLENKPSVDLPSEQPNTETQNQLREARGNAEALSLQQKIDRAIQQYHVLKKLGVFGFELYRDLVLDFDTTFDLYTKDTLAFTLLGKAPIDKNEQGKFKISMNQRWNALFPNEQKQIEDAFPDRQVLAPTEENKEGDEYLDLREYAELLKKFDQASEDEIIEMGLNIYDILPDNLKKYEILRNFEEADRAVNLISFISGFWKEGIAKNFLTPSFSFILRNFEEADRANKTIYSIKNDLGFKRILDSDYQTRAEILEDNIENFFATHFADLDSGISEELQLEIQTSDDEVYKNILKDFEEYTKDPSNKNIRSLRYKINQVIKGSQNKSSVIDNNSLPEAVDAKKLESSTQSSTDQDPWQDQEDTNQQNPTTKSETDPTKPLETEPKSPMEKEFDSFGDKKIEDITNEASQVESRKSLVTSINVPNKLKLFYLIAFYSQKLQEINEMSEEQRATELKKLLNKIENDINNDNDFAARIIRRVKNVAASKNYFGQDEALSKITTIYIEEDFETSDQKPKDPKNLDKQSDDSRGQNYYEDVKDQYGENAGMSHYISSLHEQFVDANTWVEQQIFDDGTNVFITDGMVFLVREGGSLQVVYNPDWDSDSLKLLVEDIRDQKLTEMKDFKEYCFYNGFKYISLKHSNTRAKDKSMIVDGNWKENQRKLIEDANGFVGWEINLHKNYDKKLFEELRLIFSFSQLSTLTNLTVAYNNLENVEFGNSNEEEIASLTKAVDSLFKGNIDGKTFDKMSVTNKIDEMIQDQKIEESGYLDNQIVVDYINSLRILAIFLDNLKDFCHKADVDNNPELQKLIKDAKKLLGQFKAKNKYIKEEQILNQYISHTFEEARYRLMLLALKSK